MQAINFMNSILRTLFTTLFLPGLLLLLSSSHSRAQTQTLLYAVQSIPGSGDTLFAFSSTTPHITTTVTIQGLPVGMDLAGIDFRPGTQTLYGLGVIPAAGSVPATIQLFAIDPSLGTTQTLSIPFTLNNNFANS